MTPPATYTVVNYVHAIHPGIVAFDIDLAFIPVDDYTPEHVAVLLRAWDEAGNRLDLPPGGLTLLQQDRVASKGWDLVLEWRRAGRVPESELGYRITLSPVGVRALEENDG